MEQDKKREMGMYKAFYAMLVIVWIMDILNFPCMEFLDSSIPVNGLAWFLIWILIPSTTAYIKRDD